MAFLLGLGLSNHWETEIIFIPGLVIYFFLNFPKEQGASLGIKPLMPLLVCFFLGLSPLLYLPLRSPLNPVLNLGSPDRLTLFLADLSRHYVSEREPSLMGTLGKVMAGKGSWGSLGSLGEKILKNQGLSLSAHLWREWGLPGLILILWGLGAWYGSRGKKILLFILVSLTCLFLSLLSFLFIQKEGNSDWILDNFLLPSNWMAALFITAGLTAFLIRLKSSPTRLFPLACVLTGAIPLLTAFQNFPNLRQDGQLLPYDYGENLLKSTPRNALFFAESDPDYFSLYYLQQVAHQRSDVRMVPAFILFESWGVRQTERLYPELGLSASSVSFPDHFARILYATSELVGKSRGRIPVAFSYFNGAFHQNYLARNPDLLFEKSGIVYVIHDPALPPPPQALAGNLNLRQMQDFSPLPSLDALEEVYREAGLFP